MNQQNENFLEHQQEIKSEKTFSEIAQDYLDTLKDFFFGKDRAKIIPVSEEMKEDHLLSDK